MEIQLRSIGTRLGVPALGIDLSVRTSDENQGVVPVVLFVVVEVHEWSIHHDDLTGHVFYGCTVVTVFLVGSTVTIRHISRLTCSEVVATRTSLYDVVGSTGVGVTNTSFDSVG